MLLLKVTGCGDCVRCCRLCTSIRVDVFHIAAASRWQHRTRRDCSWRGAYRWSSCRRQNVLEVHLSPPRVCKLAHVECTRSTVTWLAHGGATGSNDRWWSAQQIAAVQRRQRTGCLLRLNLTTCRTGRRRRVQIRTGTDCHGTHSRHLVTWIMRGSGGKRRESAIVRLPTGRRRGKLRVTSGWN